MGFRVVLCGLTGDLHWHETTGHRCPIHCSEINSGRMRHGKIGQVLGYRLYEWNLLQSMFRCKFRCLIIFKKNYNE